MRHRRQVCPCSKHAAIVRLKRARAILSIVSLRGLSACGGGNLAETFGLVALAADGLLFTSHRQYFTRIEDALWIKRLFDLPHDGYAGAMLRF